MGGHHNQVSPMAACRLHDCRVGHGANHGFLVADHSGGLGRGCCCRQDLLGAMASGLH